jgi:hypothetical protein
VEETLTGDDYFWDVALYCLVLTDVSVVLTTFIIKTIIAQILEIVAPPKRRSTSATLHGAKSHREDIFTLIAVRT